MFGNRKNDETYKTAAARAAVSDRIKSEGYSADPVTAIAQRLRKLTYEEFIELADELGEQLKDTQKPVDVALHEWAKARTSTPVTDETWTHVAESDAPVPAPAPVSADAPAVARDPNDPYAPGKTNPAGDGVGG